MIQTIEEGVTRRALLTECQALVREVDEGTNTNADPELVALARRIVEADRRKTKPVQEALAAISRTRASGGGAEEQDAAAEPFMVELHAVEAEIDLLILELAAFGPSAASREAT